MATQKDGGLVSRAVREALGTLVSPHVYGQLLARSLQASGLTEVPESGRALVSWIEGALNREIELAVGIDAAELVAAQLAPIVAHASAAERVPARVATPAPAIERAPARVATPAPALEPRAAVRGSEGSGSRPRDAFGSEQPTGIVTQPKPRAPRSDLAKTARLKLTRQQMKELQGSDEASAGHTTRPQSIDPHSSETQKARTRVLAASSASAAIRALQSYLAGTAEVLEVSDLVSLLDLLEGSGLVDPIVLLDCQRPTVHVTSIAAIGEDLPRGTTIVLWGASDETWNQIDRDRFPSCRWVRCSNEATTDDVGSLCAMLIGAVRR